VLDESMAAAMERRSQLALQLAFGSIANHHAPDPLARWRRRVTQEFGRRRGWLVHVAILPCNF
jgi:hypothetical protein